MPNKPEWYYQQSAVIPYFVKNNRTQILLITTRKKKKWTLPKGIVEPDLTPEESALQEAYEEAGIEGKILNGLFDTFRYDKWRGTCFVKVYLMQLTWMHEHWPEDELRTRKAFTPYESISVIGRKEMQPVLEKFRQHCNNATR